MLKKLTSVLILCLFPFFISDSFAALKTVTYDVQGLDWSYGDTSTQEHWMPFYLPVVQTGFRWKAGIRLSGMAIAVKCPLRIELSYDDAQANAGNNLKIQVKATPLASDQRTFDSNFGINLPNQIQLGLINIAGLPDILPWYTLDGDLWDLISVVPEVGEAIATAATNIGVAMNSKEALPDLGDSKEYHDTRTLFSIDLTKLLEGNKKNALIGKIWGWLGPKKDAITAAIQLAKMCNENVATDTAKDLIGKGIEVLAGIAQISLKGDPYFAIKSEKIAVIVDWNIGGRTNGSNAINLIPTQKQGEFTINIPPFVQSGEKIELVPSSVSYEFKLDQKLQFQIAVPVVGDINLGDASKKTVVYKYLNKILTASDFKLDIPLSATTLPIAEFHVTPGCSSATVLWASPNIDLRGTVDVFQGLTKIKSISESAFTKSHALMVDGLSADTRYTFHLSCVDRSNIPYSVDDVIATTQRADSCSSWSQNTSVGDVSISGDSATASFNSITFNWTTSKVASTELYFSNSPDFGSSYLSAVKKADGSFAVGWADYSSVDRKLETSHSITIPNLQTGTTYHCRLVSWTYKNDKASDGFDVQVTKTLEVTTLSAPSTKVLVRLNNNPVNNVTVAVFKTATPNNKTLYVTGADGYTPVILLEQGSSYQASVTGQACYNDSASSTLSVAGNAKGALSNINLDITRKPSPGGYVYDNLNNPLAGVTVRMPATDSSVSVTTDNNGYYTIDRPQFRGEKDVVISKTGYITQTIKGTFDNCGLFAAAPVVLSSGAITLNVHVTAGGNPLSGAAIRAISVSWEMGRATTDAQGNATITQNRATIPTSSPLSIEVTPPQGSKAIANTFDVGSYNLSQPTSIDVNCDVDTSVPAITSMTLNQYGQNGIQVSFTASKPVVYYIEIKKPDNQIVKVDYPTTINAFNMTTSVDRATFTVGNPATYKVLLKVKDDRGNETSSGYVDFAVFADSSWNFKVKAKTTNSAVLSWNKFPREAEFSKYEIVRAGNVVATLSDINTTEYTAPGLAPYTSYTYTLRCINKSNTAIGNGATLTFTSSSISPVISNLVVTPENPALNEPIQVTAQITDTDTTIQNVNLYLLSKGKKEGEEVLASQQPNATSVQFSHTFTMDKPGEYDIALTATDESSEAEAKRGLTILQSEKPQIAFQKTPSNCKIGQDCAVTVKVTNAAKIQGELTYTIEWGDGNREASKAQGIGKAKGAIHVDEEEKGEGGVKGGSTFVHQYTTEGNFTVSVTASLKIQKSTLTSEPITASVEVTTEPLGCELTSRSPSGANEKSFHIKSIPGSYPVSSWEMYFGDTGATGQAATDSADVTGKGDVEKDVSHYYSFKTGERIRATENSRQPYIARFKVTDSQGRVCEKTLTVTVSQNGTGALGNNLPGFSQGAGAQALLSGAGQGPGLIKGGKTGMAQGTTRDTAQQTAEQVAGQAQEAAQQAVGQTTGTVRQLAAKHQTQTTTAAQTTQQTTAATEQQAVTKELIPSVDVSLEDIKIPTKIYLGETADITVYVKNNAAVEAQDCVVSLKTEDGFKDKQTVSLRTKEKKPLKFSWTPKKEGRQKITALLEYKEDVDVRNNEKSETAEVKKKEEIPTISLGKLTIEGLKGEELMPGKPLVVLLDMSSSLAFEKPLDANISLKGKQNSEEFTQKIEALKKGKNTFTWELMKEIKPDKYRLNVEVSCSEIKYKEKAMVEFVVPGEDK